MPDVTWTLDSIVTLKKYAADKKTVRQVLKEDEGYIRWIRDNVSNIKLGPDVLAVLEGGGSIPDIGISVPDIPLDLNISGAGEVQLQGATLRTMIEALNALNQCVIPHPIHGQVLLYTTAELVKEPLERILGLLIEIETRLRGNRPVSFTLLPDTQPVNYPTASLPSVPDSSNFQGSVDDLPF